MDNCNECIHLAADGMCAAQMFEEEVPFDLRIAGSCEEFKAKSEAAGSSDILARIRAEGQRITDLCAEKNQAYGSSFEKTGAFLRLLYPDGIKPEQYEDLGLIFRVFDKQMRIATRKGAFGESPWSDVCGYGLLGAAKDAGEKKP